VSTLLPRTADYAGLTKTWRVDVVAGLTVGIVALPLALAFGVSSGVGAEAGLVTAVVAGLVAAVFGGSNVQVSGPTGAMVVVLAPIVVSHGAEVVGLIALMAGVVVVVAGVLHLGRLVSIVPWPVVEGFTLGIAVIIFLQQVPAAVGAQSGAHSSAVLAAFESIRDADLGTSLWPVLAVLAVAVVMLLAPLVHPRLPGSIIAIILVTVIAVLAALPLERIGELPASLPAPALPALSLGTLAELIGPALTVAALAAIESLLSARVAASMADTGPVEPDRELVGQGLASIASGLFGGMPATGAIARTAVNVRTGARTRVAAIVHSLVLLATIYLAASIVSHVPLAALAGVLMVTAVRMVSVATVRSVVGASRSDALIFVVTAIITITFDLIVALGIGIVVATLFALRSLANAQGVHREQLPGAAEPGDERIALFRLEGALFFGTAERLLERVSEINDVTVVILRMSQLHVLDATGARVLSEIITRLERRGVTVLVKGIQPRHARLASKVGVTTALRHEKHLFTELAAAVEHARGHVARAN
jgi:SulP family sulfate permease